MASRVLVFPCGSEIGLEIYRALNDSIHIELFGASSAVSNHGSFIYKNYIEGVPFVEDQNFINYINQIIDKYKIDYLFPAHDSVVLKFAENLEKLHCKLIGSPRVTCEICRSKKKTYEVFKNIVAVPKIYDVFDINQEFPVFLKPDVGQGSKGTFLANNMEDINFYLKKDASLLTLEYLPGKEYTIDCFTDRYGTLRFIGPRERVRISNGISVNTHPVTDNRFNVMAKLVNDTLKFRGAWFFQVKESKDNEAVLMEIAPRIAGAMGLYRNLGVNLPLLSFFDANNIDVKINLNSHILEMDRALFNRFKIHLVYEHVYIDLDDTIIIANSVNLLVISFLYQCLNRGIKIHLITRHQGNIQDYLRKYRIELIFDSITVIDQAAEKSNFIKESSAIFIDDSFSERLLVHQKLGIPTFEVNTIESLLDRSS